MVYNRRRKVRSFTDYEKNNSFFYIGERGMKDVKDRVLSLVGLFIL